MKIIFLIAAFLAINLADQKLLMRGDIVWDEVYQQEGICTQFGRMGVFDDWVPYVYGSIIKANTVFYEVDNITGLPTGLVGFSSATYPTTPLILPNPILELVPLHGRII